MSYDNVGEADVILLSEDDLSSYPRVSGVLLEADKEGIVVLGCDREEVMGEFYFLFEEHSLDLGDFYV